MAQSPHLHCRVLQHGAGSAQGPRYAFEKEQAINPFRRQWDPFGCIDDVDIFVLQMAQLAIFQQLGLRGRRMHRRWITL